MDIEEIKTYLNINGFPMIRKCQNCKFWKQENISEKQNIGYCKLEPMLFAFTLQKTVFPMTKDFYLCVSHQFINEEHLASSSTPVLLKDSIKKKEDIK